METLRPNWFEYRYHREILDLSNNLCYDSILLDQVNDLFKNTKIDIRQYTDEATAYLALSKHHDIDPKNIAIGHGIGELITRILNLPQIGRISIVTPTWPMVEVYSRLLNLSFETTLDYSCNTLYIANPNGLDGKCLTKNQILEMLERFGLVILDEAYGDFADECQSLIDEADRFDNLIVLKTFSKSLSLAGLRFGYAISNKSIIRDLQEVRPSCSLNSMANQLCADLLKLMPAHISRMKETRDFLEQTYECDHSQGNFVIFKSVPESLESNVLMKKVPGVGIRMSLVDLQTLRGLL